MKKPETLDRALAKSSEFIKPVMDKGLEVRPLSVEEEFLIAVEKAGVAVAITEEKAFGDRIWRWVKDGVKRVLELSTSGLTSATRTVREQLEDELGGEWDLQSVLITLSQSPSATIAVAKKS